MQCLSDRAFLSVAALRSKSVANLRKMGETFDSARFRGRDRGFIKCEAEIRRQSKASRGEKLSGAWTIPLGVARLSPTD